MGDPRTRERNPNWRGGRVTDPRGYVLLRMPEHHRADVRGYVYEHVVVAERVLGRPLRSGERVVHDDGDPSNNAPDNLRVPIPRDLAEIVACACGCGQAFTRLDRAGRPRRFVTGHNTVRLRTDKRPKTETAAGLSPAVTEYVLDLFAGLCAYGCGRTATEWDHVVPWSAGGSFRSPGNAVPACRSCNAEKSSSPDPWPWIDRGAASGQAAAWLDIVALAFEWGELEMPA